MMSPKSPLWKNTLSRLSGMVSPGDTGSKCWGRRRRVMASNDLTGKFHDEVGRVVDFEDVSELLRQRLGLKVDRVVAVEAPRGDGVPGHDHELLVGQAVDLLLLEQDEPLLVAVLHVEREVAGVIPAIRQPVRAPLAVAVLHADRKHPLRQPGFETYLQAGLPEPPATQRVLGRVENDQFFAGPRLVKEAGYTGTGRSNLLRTVEDHQPRDQWKFDPTGCALCHTEKNALSSVCDGDDRRHGGHWRRGLLLRCPVGHLNADVHLLGMVSGR